VIRISSGQAAVTVRQDPGGPGPRAEITAGTPAGRKALAVTLDGRLLPT
jgi:hypothetical protein